MMSASMVKDHLVDSLLKAGKYSRFEQIQPAAILWPDKNKQWEPVIPLLQSDLPELLVYGQYQLSLTALIEPQYDQLMGPAGDHTNRASLWSP